MARGFPESVPGLVDGPRWCELVHHVRPSSESRKRKAAAGDLPEDGQVRRHPVELLGSSARDAEARDDLVEDEQGARGVAERAQRLEEARRRRHDAHVPGDRLDDDRGEAFAVALDRSRRRIGVVVRGDDGVAGRAARDSRRGRQPERHEAGTGLGEERVGVAVVAARELEDAVATSRAAREPDRAHRRLRAGRDQPHLLDRRHRVDDLLGELDLALGRRPEGRAVRRRLLHGLHDLGVGVAEHERAPGHHPVHVAPPLGVLEVGAFAPACGEGLPGRHGFPCAHR